IAEDLWQSNQDYNGPGTQTAAILRPVKRQELQDFKEYVDKRFTWRGNFGRADRTRCKDLQNWASEADDVTLVYEPPEIEALAQLNDAASIITMRDDDFRKELLHWMRLSKKHPRYSQDGLNSASMHMTAIEAFAAKVVLKSAAFKILDTMGLAKSVVSEKSKTLSSTGIVLFHRPFDESPIVTGRYFYRFWLNLTRLGFAAWPMAVLADYEATATEISRKHNIPDNHRLVNALRVGTATGRPSRARLPVTELLC
ncbi:MAG: hypothetical protein AAF412_10885, partial [Pseudomonadota bacterium]